MTQQKGKMTQQTIEEKENLTRKKIVSKLEIQARDFSIEWNIFSHSIN